MGEGPIPWNRIVDYGERHQLDEDALELFIHVIRCMDNKYLEIQAEEYDKRTKK